MRIDLHQLKTEIEPLAVAHGAELVAIEWLQGPGRGILRLYIDRPGADPRTPPEQRGIGVAADLCVAVSRDVGAMIETQDLIEDAYDLEVSSPGFERPVQRREDFERFKGLVAHIKVRAFVDGHGSLEAALAGTSDAAEGDFTVHVTVDGKTLDIAARNITRARLAEIKPPKPAKQPKGWKKPREAPTSAPTTDHDRPISASEDPRHKPQGH